jgi:hypothetical protein
MPQEVNKLPDVDKPVTQGTAGTTETGPINIPQHSEVNSKELVIAFGVIIVAGVIFFLVKNYVSKMLVASFRKSPRSADMAGWSLFCVLLLATIAAVLGIVNSAKLFSVLYLIPIGLAMVVALIMLIIALCSKR